MGERKGVNKYYPPDFDPTKGSLNKWRGEHPLRDRARKIHQGILVIRFEMPYNIWCNGCNNHIGMGVRYNAEKSKVGNYYTTPIYKFRMKCHLCDNHFEIQTDPKNHDYVILEGARRKEQRWDPRENEQIVPEDKATQKKLATDPMYKLEHGSDDQQRGKSAVMSLTKITEKRDAFQDDYMLNKMARNKFRNEKKQIAVAKAADQALLDKSSLAIELVPESEDDRKLAGLIKYSVTKSYEQKQLEKRKAIAARPFFPSQESPTSTALVIPGKQGNTSRRAEIKRKLGLHLNSPKVEHKLEESKYKGLVRRPSKKENNTGVTSSEKQDTFSVEITETSVERAFSVTEADDTDAKISANDLVSDNVSVQAVHVSSESVSTSSNTIHPKENPLLPTGSALAASEITSDVCKGQSRSTDHNSKRSSLSQDNPSADKSEGTSALGALMATYSDSDSCGES